MRWSWRAAVPESAAAIFRIAAMAFIAVVFAFATSVRAEDAERGRALYESRCDSCHDTSVHNRAARKARDFASLRREVARWNAELGGAWTQQEIDDVTVFLNERYYGFPCPITVCAAQARAAGPANPAGSGRR